MAALSLDDLAVFVRVVERAGFASAARDLGTPTSTVSRAIERLEARAGVRLLHRSTRQVRPTSDGQELYVAIAPAVSNLRATAQTLEPTSKLPAASYGSRPLATFVTGSWQPSWRRSSNATRSFSPSSS